MNSPDFLRSLSKEDLIEAIQKSKSYNDVFRNLNVSINGNNLHIIKEKIKDNKIIVDFSKYKMKYNHNVNKSIFNTINTKEKAYWIGFLAADGYIPKNENRIRLQLSIKDEEIIDRFIIFINGDVKAKKTYKGNYDNMMVTYCVHNKEMSLALKKLGIVSPKSNKNLHLDFKNEKLNLAYLMGYYDGDGEARSPVISCGSKKFLSSIKQKYKLDSKINYKKNKFGECYSLYLGQKFMIKLMTNYPNSLLRKRGLLSYELHKNKCKCGEKKLIDSKNCTRCDYNDRFYKRKFHVDKNELKKLVDSQTISSIAKKFGVSSSSIIKRCKLLKIKK